MTSVAATVQPRAGGEQDTEWPMIVIVNGSAPRRRGTVRRAYSGREWHRFSPAQAGNSRGGIQGVAHGTVQPRAGGEQEPPATAKNILIGSAPRRRGTADKAHDDPRRGRFSPAQAGNRTKNARKPNVATVQPRAGGEQSLAASDLADETGSAPRRRGTDSVCV